MNPRQLLTTFAIALPLTAFSACASTGSTESESVSQVDDLVGWIQRVHVESELAKEKVGVATDLLRVLVSGNYKGEAIAAFGEYTKAIDASERQAEKLRGAVANMTYAAQPVFDKWSEDVLQITSPAMRRRSVARLEETRRRYQEVLATSKTSQTNYDMFNMRLRDISLFLGNDFNGAAVSEVAGEAHEVTDMAAQLDSNFNRTLDAARDYLESSALPAGPAAAPPGGAGTMQAAPTQQQPTTRTPQPEPRQEPERDSSSGLVDPRRRRIIRRDDNGGN